MPADSVKGLEFDTVFVLEPGKLYDRDPVTGPRPLYVALSRPRAHHHPLAAAAGRAPRRRHHGRRPATSTGRRTDAASRTPRRGEAATATAGAPATPAVAPDSALSWSQVVAADEKLVLVRVASGMASVERLPDGAGAPALIADGKIVPAGNTVAWALRDAAGAFAVTTTQDPNMRPRTSSVPPSTDRRLMHIGNRPGWAWFSLKDAPWWSPAAVHYALLTEKIEPAQVLPRLAGCGHDAQFNDEWVNRFDDPWDAMVDDDPDVTTVPGAMSRRWMELLADELEGDRAAAVRFLTDASNATRAAEQSLRLRDLQLFITTATVEEPRPDSGWLAQGSFWFMNAGLLTPATLLDLIELQATAAPLLLPGAEVFGVVARPDEGEFAPSRVLAAYQIGVDDPSSSVGRRNAIDRLQCWLDGEPLEVLEEVAGDVVGFTNKTARYGRIRDNFDW